MVVDTTGALVVVVTVVVVADVVVVVVVVVDVVVVVVVALVGILTGGLVSNLYLYLSTSPLEPRSLTMIPWFDSFASTGKSSSLSVLL